MVSIPLNCTSEQMPNPDSRIGLGKDLDVFGLRKVVVDWRLTAEDKRGMATGNRLLGAELDRGAFGRLRSSIPEGDSEWPSGFPMIPISFVKDGVMMNYFSLVTTVGTPQTIAAQELRVECMYPADDETEASHVKFLAASSIRH